MTGNDSGTDQQSGLRYLYAIPPTPVEQVRPVQGEQPPANELQNFTEPETTDQTLRSNRYPSYFLAPVVPYPVSPGMHQSQSRRNWTNYRYFDGRPSLYGYGRHDPDSTSWYGDAYREGFLRGSDRARFDQQGGERTVRVLGHGHRHIERGKQLFQDRQYSAAADAYKLAADTNHGDPSSRLYAAHALFATGRYRESVQYLRRAFELQPKISMLNFDLRNDYGIRQDYDEHLNNLVAALRQSPRDLDRLLLLGYIRYYSGQRDKAHMPLRAVLKLHPGDSLARQLLENCPVPDVVADQIDQTKQNQ
ncbi:MAG: hypothetical protein GXY44_04635 [Phycisphaerales bacterium]|nr:hypothetical protein [Phycisphaerales bacterium]